MIGKEYILIVIGLLESFFYSGLIFGWATLNFLLKKEGVFSHLCPDTGQTVNNVTVSSGNATVLTASYYINDYQMTPNLMSAIDGQNQTEALSYFSCNEQSKMLNLAYNIAISVGTFTGIFWGILLDKFGLRVIRLFISLFITGGALLLMFTTKDMPYLLFPAMTLCSFVGIPVRLSCLQIAELFPRQRSTLISLYSGANTASAAVFTLLKYFYDIGLNWTEMCGIFMGISFLALPFTFLFFPVRSFDEEKVKMNSKTESVEQLDEKPAALEITPQCDQKPLPLTFSIFSLSSLLYNFWFAWLMLYALYYNGSLHLWVARSSNDPNDLNTYVDILGISQLGAMILGPMVGMLIDLNLSRVPAPEANGPKHPTCSGDGADYDQTRRQVKATFWMALMTTCLLFAVQVTKFFNSNTAIITSMVFFIVFRSSVMGVSITYLRQSFKGLNCEKAWATVLRAWMKKLLLGGKYDTYGTGRLFEVRHEYPLEAPDVTPGGDTLLGTKVNWAAVRVPAFLLLGFPQQHFNKLVGITATFRSVCFLLQFPLFVWDTERHEQVSIFNMVCLVLAFSLPLHMKTPLLDVLMRKEDKAANKIYHKDDKTTRTASIIVSAP